MALETQTLPNDLKQCHILIRELATALEQRDLRVDQLMHRLDQLLRRVYGKSSERMDPAQLVLFALEEQRGDCANDSEPNEEPCAEDAPNPKRKGHGRKKLPDDLPRKRIEHDVAPEQKVCPECGTDKKRIGEEVSEQLDYIPASLFVIEHIRPKYACPCCQGHVVIADKPAQPIEKGLPGPGLLAHVITSKFADHQPLYRQSTILQRHGVEIPPSTLGGWTMASANVVEPIVDTMHQNILRCQVIQTDDTPITINDKPGTHTGRFWVYRGDGTQPYIVFDYTPTRSREGPTQFLQQYKGTPDAPRYLQADAYSGYDRLFPHNGLTEVGCMAHGRRYFRDAETSDVIRSHTALAFIGRLYRIEKTTGDLSAEERRAIRQDETQPILDDFEAWLRTEHNAVLPKSPIAQAFGYALRHWKALRQYTQDGRLSIDNNAAEREIRPIAVGRKNYLFCGSDRGGHAAAILYSLTATAKRHGLDPFHYLRDILTRIPTHPNKQIHELLPDRWKTSH